MVSHLFDRIGRHADIRMTFILEDWLVVWTTVAWTKTDNSEKRE